MREHLIAAAAAGFILSAFVSEAWSGSIVWVGDPEGAMEYLEKRAEQKRDLRREILRQKEVAKERKAQDAYAAKEFKAYKKGVEKAWKQRYGKARGRGY